MGLLQLLVLLLAAGPVLVRGLAMFLALTNELLDLTVEARGFRAALFAYTTDCSCSTTCCSCVPCSGNPYVNDCVSGP